MSGRIVIPSFMPARDVNGVPQPGALLSVYLNGTTTRATIYADAGLTTPLPNPVTADASGVFPSIFSADGSTRSISVTTADDVPLATFDDVATSTVTQIDPAAITAAVQSALSGLNFLTPDTGTGS